MKTIYILKIFTRPGVAGALLQTPTNTKIN